MKILISRAASYCANPYYPDAAAYQEGRPEAAALERFNHAFRDLF